MNKILGYIKLMRIKHYLKNCLIFIPLIFSGNFFNLEKIFLTFLGFISFGILSSSVYCINDLKDIEDDKKHPVKKNRPIASGQVSKRGAIGFTIILFLISIILMIPIIKISIVPLIIELTYFGLNIAYSCGLKKVPIVDVVILVSGFIIRLLFGAAITSIEISNWLYLTVMAGSFYLGFGKRRNEVIKQGDQSREVLKKYNKDFLDKFMYVCLILAITFYSLWCVDALTIERIGNNHMIYTIPLLLIIFMKYSLNVENDSFGDPVDVILSDKILIGLVLIFGLMILGILYL